MPNKVKKIVDHRKIYHEIIYGNLVYQSSEEFYNACLFQTNYLRVTYIVVLFVTNTTASHSIALIKVVDSNKTVACAANSNDAFSVWQLFNCYYANSR